MVLELTTVLDDSIALIATTKFNPQNLTSSAMIDGTTNLPNNNAVFTYFGILDQGLSFPNGTTATAAVQSFEPSGTLPGNTTIKGDVMSFIPDFNCELGTLNYSLPTADDPTTLWYTFKNKARNCTTGMRGRNRQPIGIKDPSRGKVPPRQLVGTPSPVSCIEENSTSYTRWILLMTDLRYKQALANGSTQSHRKRDYNISDYVEVASMSAVLCEPTYDVKISRVAFNPSDVHVGTGFSVDIKHFTTNHNDTFDHFTTDDLSLAFHFVLQDSNTVFGDVIRGDLDLDLIDPFFKLMSIENGHSGYTAFLDAETMARSARNVFRGLSVQSAAQYILVPTKDNFTGQAEYSEKRLHIHILSFSLMVISFVLTICSGLMIFFIRPRNVVPRDTDSTAAIALILSGSTDIKVLLQGCGHSSNRSLAEQLRQRTFWTTTNNSYLDSQIPKFSIETGLEKSSIRQPVCKSSIKAKKRQWRPLAFYPTMTLLTLGAPIVAIAVLEFLQGLSNRRNGLTDVSSNYTISHSLSTYAPTLVMLMVALLYSSLDSAVSTLAPFQALSAGNCTSSRGIFANLFGKLPPVAIWLSLRDRHIAAFFTAIAALLASVLTIITSGLYNVDHVSRFQKYFAASGYEYLEVYRPCFVLYIMLHYTSLCEYYHKIY